MLPKFPSVYVVKDIYPTCMCNAHMQRVVGFVVDGIVCCPHKIAKSRNVVASAVKKSEWQIKSDNSLLLST